VNKTQTQDIDTTIGAAAAEVVDDPSNEALRSARYVWQNMYLGAFGALKIPNTAMTRKLAEVTCSDTEAAHAIGLLRDADEGDRVYPALAWLRAQRGVS
jgi:hypothetical protein